MDVLEQEGCKKCVLYDTREEKKVRNRTKTKNKFKKCWKINYDTRDIVQKINMEKDKETQKGWRTQAYRF